MLQSHNDGIRNNINVVNICHRNNVIDVDTFMRTCIFSSGGVLDSCFSLEFFIHLAGLRSFNRFHIDLGATIEKSSVRSHLCSVHSP